MVIGAMPGDYYKYAQGTADSTLKNHLGAIICCGKRYRYGSGAKHSWDAFFYTDRDTMTNEVLDMYSNNHRYFDPLDTTASVAGFDIEHMLPKSWWGRTVNEAYCDLYHLVPGDYSANRSKSNHAPGVPTDTTFWNGSFATGNVSVEVNGTPTSLKVFCPADEYKGDFARAYFYIATCYGDSLTWLTLGEPGIAMTNEGWQEFRPWLRDLLVAWHRMDPVSEKELTRAIEVNKIQGNRNPFIDYPELVEYIWGNKQGQTVDFRNLTQSYGDAYDDTPTGVCATQADEVSIRKIVKGGSVIIERNGRVFTILGQVIR
jgi:endonuclease I